MRKKCGKAMRTRTKRCEGGGNACKKCSHIAGWVDNQIKIVILEENIREHERETRRITRKHEGNTNGGEKQPPGITAVRSKKGRVLLESR